MPGKNSFEVSFFETKCPNDEGTSDAFVILEEVMKKGKKGRKVVQKVKVKSRDIEVEIREHIHALLDVLSDKKRARPQSGRAATPQGPII